MLLNFNSPSYKSDIYVSLMLRHLTFSVLLSFDPNNDFLNCSFYHSTHHWKIHIFSRSLNNWDICATSLDMINGVNQNIIFLTMKKILRPFSYKLTNSKTQILLYINITKTSVNLFIVQFVGFFFFSSVRDNPSSRKPSFQAKRRVSIPIYNF